MPTVAADYAWFSSSLLGEGHCLTVASGLSSQEFLDRIGAEDQGEAVGLNGLWERWEELESSDTMVIGVATVPGDGSDWALAVEIFGVHGVYGELLRPLSAGGRAVTHLRTGTAKDYFAWWDNSQAMTTFEPLFAYARKGRTPDALNDVMAAVGFDLSDGRGRSYELHTEAAFALTERLTGVHVTPDLLDQVTYRVGVVEIPDP
ncbi:DUF6461 domain-containing protein [Spirillospora sp. CA-253888]